MMIQTRKNLELITQVKAQRPKSDQRKRLHFVLVGNHRELPCELLVILNLLQYLLAMAVLHHPTRVEVDQGVPPQQVKPVLLSN
jgi:hypothetical protein